MKLGLYGLRMHKYLTSEARYNMCGIMELLGHCKGGNLNLGVVRLFHLPKKEKSGSIYLVKR